MINELNTGQYPGFKSHTTNRRRKLRQSYKDIEMPNELSLHSSFWITPRELLTLWTLFTGRRSECGNNVRDESNMKTGKQ